MDFFIKQNSSLPELKFPLTQKIMEKYDVNAEKMKNVAITFSMIDAENGLFRIANVSANLVINSDRPNHPDEKEFTLAYRFTTTQTSKSGRFIGEFVVDFLGESSCGKIKFPVGDVINILISDSITKTTII